MRRRGFADILSLVLQFLLATAALSSQSPSEYEVKAAYLLNFAKFVEWPESALPVGVPLNICLIGDDPFGRVLDQVVEGESLDEHKISILRLHSISEGTCHVVYFGKALKETKALTTVPPGVLTVGEEGEFLRGGGMVAFVVENRRVRFDINMAAMRKAGVRVSSRLLRVARVVKP